MGIESHMPPRVNVRTAGDHAGDGHWASSWEVHADVSDSLESWGPVRALWLFRYRLTAPKRLPGFLRTGPEFEHLRIGGGWGISLVGQWIRIHLPVQRTWIQALVWDDPNTCHSAIKPEHNY